MSQTMDREQVNRAQRTVLGVMTAKNLGSVEDVNFLITSYLTEEQELGHTVSSAWSVLFGASVNVLDALVKEDAAHHAVTPAKRINQWSVSHARSLT